MYKNIRLLFFGLALMLSATSCEEWLDVDNSSEIKEKDQFKTASGIKDAVIGTYINMTDKNLYSKQLTWGIVDVLSGQYSTLPSLAQLDKVQKFEYKSVEASRYIDKIWIKQYNVIANVNNAISNIEKNKSVLDSRSLSIIQGELLGLRVFLHFDMLRLYGYSNVADKADKATRLTIPYVMECTKDIIAQKSYTETINLLLTDIDAAIKLLEKDPIYAKVELEDDFETTVNFDGFFSKRQNRMNYYAAKALKARILMWRGLDEDYIQAKLIADDIIKNSSTLLQDVGAVNSDRLLYKECLFGLDVNALDIIIQRALEAGDANYSALVYEEVFCEEMFETSNVNIGLADIRFNALMTSVSDKYICIKLRQSDNITKNRIPLMRISEMYYIAAECAVKAGAYSDAITYLNTVREKRGIIEELASTLGESEVVAEIDKEYRKEFTYEGQLFFYYKRLGRTTYPGISETLEVTDAIYMLPYPDKELENGNRIQ